MTATRLRVTCVLGLLAAMTLAACVPESNPVDGPLDAVDSGQLSGFEIVDLEVDGVRYPVALADTVSLRRQGLRGVDDLGDLAGMWFTWGGEEVDSAFTMQGTLIPLDIAFVDSSGRVVDKLTMIPCSGSDCPLYRSNGPFVAALEVPLDGPINLDLDTVITALP